MPCFVHQQECLILWPFRGRLFGGVAPDGSNSMGGNGFRRIMELDALVVG